MFVVIFWLTLHWKPIFLLTSICCLIRSRATTFSAPLGIITSAYFFVGIQNSSKAGLTRVVYWCNTCSRSRPRSDMSRNTRLLTFKYNTVHKKRDNWSIQYWGIVFKGYTRINTTVSIFSVVAKNRFLLYNQTNTERIKT